MLILNQLPNYSSSLDPSDQETLGLQAAAEVQRFLAHRKPEGPTPLHSLPGLAQQLKVGSLFVKDEGQRLGLGSFKALGGSYAVIRLVLERAALEFGKPVDVIDLHSDAVRNVASRMTVACATDGNHGRSVAQGAALVGARSMIFVHSGVSEERAKAIARFGAEIIRVEGNYDDSVATATRVSTQNGWEIVSDTSWPGYMRTPSLVMQGYTAIVSEALAQMAEPPTHVFIQAGVGGIAAALAGHLAIRMGKARPKFIVVEPDRAACIVQSVIAGRPIKIAQDQPTVMAMLECYEPSLVAWRILSCVADAFMTVDDQEAVSVMKRLARPIHGDPAVVAGESGGAGLAGLIQAASHEQFRTQLAIDAQSRVFIVNTEGATDLPRYRELVGIDPEEVLAKAVRA